MCSLKISGEASRRRRFFCCQLNALGFNKDSLTGYFPAYSASKRFAYNSSLASGFILPSRFDIQHFDAHFSRFTVYYHPGPSVYHLPGIYLVSSRRIRSNFWATTGNHAGVLLRDFAAYLSCVTECAMAGCKMKSPRKKVPKSNETG